MGRGYMLRLGWRSVGCGGIIRGWWVVWGVWVVGIIWFIGGGIYNMTILYQIYCKDCEKNTGIATSKKEALEEMTYTCLRCKKRGKAKEAIIKPIQKENWENSWEDW